MSLLEDLKKMREEIEISINNNKELLKSYESEYYQCKALLEVQTKEYNRLRKLIRDMMRTMEKINLTQVVLHKIRR